MAAALRALRRLPAATPARLLPSSIPGLFPKLYAAAAPAAAASVTSMVGVHSSPPLVPSVLRRYCSASIARGGSLASVRRAYASPLQVPSPMLMRHHGRTKCSDEAAVQFVVEKLQGIDNRQYVGATQEDPDVAGCLACTVLASVVPGSGSPPSESRQAGNARILRAAELERS